MLELIELRLGDPAPHSCHREDHRISAGASWLLRGTARTTDLLGMCDPVAPLWANGFHPQNDRMPQSVADRQSGSLRLIRVERPIWVWRMYDGKPKARLVFSHAGDEYNLSVTDPEAVRAEPAHSEARAMPGAYLLCISVGELFHDEMFKLVAGILPLSEEAP